MKLKDEHGGGYANYDIEFKKMYKPHSKNNMFSTTHRIHMIRTILEGQIADGGAGLRLESMMRHNIIQKFFPMHHKEKRKWLLANWATWRKMFTKQPVEEIRNYFGEEIGLYFGWLGFFTKWLWFASAFGVLCFVLWLVAKLRGEKWGLWVNTVYSIFLALWATAFLEFWKRKQNTYAQRWGTDDYEDTESERRSYRPTPHPHLVFKFPRLFFSGCFDWV
jgi:Calcium-activated chloride channel/Anoctamin, dimerisation domain